MDINERLKKLEERMNRLETEQRRVTGLFDNFTSEAISRLDSKFDELMKRIDEKL